MTQLLAVGLVGEVFSHVTVIVQDKGWYNQVLSNKEGKHSIKTVNKSLEDRSHPGYTSSEAATSSKTHLWLTPSPGGKGRSSCTNSGGNGQAARNPRQIFLMHRTVLPLGFIQYS